MPGCDYCCHSIYSNHSNSVGLQDFEGREVKGWVLFSGEIKSAPCQDSSSEDWCPAGEESVRSSKLLWPGLKSAVEACCDWSPWRILGLCCLLIRDAFIWQHGCLATSERLKCWIYSRVLSVSQLAVWWFVAFCLFFFPFTSEASPQVVASFTVAMATAHGKLWVFVRKEGEKKKTFHLPLQG